MNATNDELLVIDCSIAIAWCYSDEQDDYSQSVLDSLSSNRVIVPALWHVEVANVLVVGERRKRSTQADTASWTGFLRSLPISVDDQTSSHAWSDTLHLARTHKLSAYDAAYLELAMRRSLPLATLDEALKAAANTAGVSLYRVR
jgi:predicted nucleic acid-binding protein